MKITLMKCLAAVMVVFISAVLIAGYHLHRTVDLQSNMNCFIEFGEFINGQPLYEATDAYVERYPTAINTLMLVSHKVSRSRLLTSEQINNLTFEVYKASITRLEKMSACWSAGEAYVLANYIIHQDSSFNEGQIEYAKSIIGKEFVVSNSVIKEMKFWESYSWITYLPGLEILVLETSILFDNVFGASI